MYNNNSSFSSTASSQHSADDYSDTDDEQANVKKCLRNLTFTGVYNSNIYIEAIADYRAELIVRGDANPHFIASLEYARTKLLQQQQRRRTFDDTPPLWIGATLREDVSFSTPAAEQPQLHTDDTALVTTRQQQRQRHSSLEKRIWTIWTQLPPGTTIGQHRFKVKTIRWRPNEIMIKVRLADDDDDRETSSRANESASTTFDEMNTDSSAKLNQTEVNFDLDALIDRGALLTAHCWSALCAGAVRFADWLSTREYSWQRAAATVKYIGSLALLLIVLALQLVAAFGHWSLLFMVESRKWWVAVRPVVQQLIDLLAKIIGAVFILLSMIWRDMFCALFGGVPKPHAPRQQLQMQPYRRDYNNAGRRHLPWRPRDY